MIARGGGILGDRWRASCKPNQELRGGRGGKHAGGGSCRGLRPHLDDTVTQGSLRVPTSTVNALCALWCSGRECPKDVKSQRAREGQVLKPMLVCGGGVGGGGGLLSLGTEELDPRSQKPCRPRSRPRTHPPAAWDWERLRCFKGGGVSPGPVTSFSLAGGRGASVPQKPLPTRSSAVRGSWAASLLGPGLHLDFSSSDSCWQTTSPG